MSSANMQTRAACSEVTWAYVLTCLTMMLGYGLFICGILVPSWRLEIGYTYGLWVRCDGHVCRYVFVGFTSFMGVVQGGVIISMLLLTTSMLGLLLEAGLKAARLGTKCLVHTNTAVSTTAAMGEILAALTLAYYGYKTVMAIERLPVLTTGFALTGLGTMVLLLGSISRAMGAPATWGDGVCCLTANRRYKDPLHYNMATQSQSQGSNDYKPRMGGGTVAGAGTGDQKMGLISCFHKESNAYRSVTSTSSSSVDKGYRHYEEISFEEMPHPPLELLIPPPHMNPPWNYQQQSTNGLDYQPYLYTTSQLDNNLSSASSSFQYLEMNAQQQQQQQQQLQQQQQQQQQQHYAIYQQRTPENIPTGYIKSLEFVPQASPRQQRSIIRSAQQQLTAVSRGLSTMTTKHSTEEVAIK